MIRELGGEAVAFYLAGGITGQALEGLIERSGIAAVRVPIAGLTRVSLTVYETSTGHEPPRPRGRKSPRGVPQLPGGALDRRLRLFRGEAASPAACHRTSTRAQPGWRRRAAGGWCWTAPGPPSTTLAECI